MPLSRKRQQAHFRLILSLSLACALPALSQTSSSQQLSALATLDQAMSGKKPSLAAVRTALEVETLFLAGDYNGTLNKGAQAIAKGGEIDARLLYFHGRAAYDIGLFDAARRDFSAIVEYRPYNGWDSARKYVAQIERVREMAPTNVTQVADDEGRLLFRVYCEEDNEWSKGIIALLPAAYRINRELLGQKTPSRELPVFIFSDATRFRNFVERGSPGKPFGSWAWAVGSSDGLCFCQHLNGVAPQDVNSVYFRSTVVHELNHCFVKRITGNTILPRWFEEGLAMMAADTAVPEQKSEYEERFQKVLQNGALLSLSQESDHESFQTLTELFGLRRSQADTFAQAWSMTESLVSILTPQKIKPFLEEVRATHSFDKALQHLAGLSPQEFYDQWREQLR